MNKQKSVLRYIYEILDMDEVFDIPPVLEDSDRRLRIYFEKKNEYINNIEYQIIYSVEEYY